jgi:hypothetical protein
LQERSAAKQESLNHQRNHAAASTAHHNNNSNNNNHRQHGNHQHGGHPRDNNNNNNERNVRPHTQLQASNPCPNHPNSNHTWGACFHNPANANAHPNNGNQQYGCSNNRSNHGANGNGNNRASNNVGEPATNSAVAEINMAEPDEDLTIGLTPVPNVQESGARAGMEPQMFESLVASPGIDSVSHTSFHHIDSFSCSSQQERTTAHSSKLI